MNSALRSRFVAIMFSLLLFGFAGESTKARPADPIPYISTVSPLSMVPGAADFTLTVNGANFIQECDYWSRVYWGTTALSTHYVNSGKLTATVPANLIATGGTGWITVVNGSGAQTRTSNLAFVSVANPTSGFTPAQFTYPIANSGGLFGLTQGDFNGDGNMDLAVADLSGKVVIFLGKGDGTFQQGVAYPDVPESIGIAAGDVNGDGKLDLVIGHYNSSSAITVLLGNGDGTFQAPVGFGPSSEQYWPVLADFNRDGFLDVLIPEYDSNIVWYYQGNGDGTFQGPVNVGILDAGAISLTVGDFNGDGVLDYMAGNDETNNVSLFLGNGNGTFQSPQRFPGQGLNWVSANGDFNEDGNLDFIGGNNSSSSATLLLNNANGGFLPYSSLNMGASMQSIAVADLNADGHADLFGGAGNNLELLFGNGDGTFNASVSSWPQNDYVFGVLAGSFAPTQGVSIAAADNSNGNLVVYIQTLSVTPAATDFGSVAVSQTSTASAFTVLNNTPVSVTIQGASITGTNSADFNLAGSTCGSTLASSASCTVMVTFAPTALGSRSAILTITDSAPGGTQTTALTGTGLGVPLVSLSPASLTFSSQNVNTTSGSQTITLKNTGLATLNISGISVSGTNSGDFAQTNTCSAGLVASASCNINVTFTPSAGGTRTATIQIADDAQASPQSAALSGSGLLDPVTMSTNSLTFTGRPDGSLSGAQQVVFTNIGSSVLSIASISITGANSSDFAQTNNCGNSVAVQGSCTIAVTFTPGAVGTRAAAISIADGSLKSPHIVSLSGTGQDFAVAVSGAQTIAGGSTATFQVTVTPESGLSQAIALTCSGAPAPSACVVTPNSVTLNGATASSSTLTFTSTANTIVVRASPRGTPTLPLVQTASLCLLCALVALFLRRNQTEAKYEATKMLFTTPALAFILFSVSACAGLGASASKSSPSATYTLTVSGAAGSLTHSATTQVTVK